MKTLLAIGFLLCATLAPAQDLVNSAQNEIVFRNVNVVPMDQERVLENQTVVVKGGRITAISDARRARPGRGATVIDAQGKYLIPGLAEMHAHVPPVDDLAPMKEVLFLFAANGITTIRGMLGHPRHLELRSSIRSGETLGPNFYTTGPSFNGNSVKTADQAREMVRQQKTAGYDYLKVHPGLTQETFGAMAEAAKAQNIPVVGHVSFDVGIWRSLDAGYNSIDHLDGFIEGMVPGIEKMTAEEVGLFALFVADKADERQIPRLMSRLKETNTWVVPTQALAERWFSPEAPEKFMQTPEMKYMDPNTRASWQKSAQNLHANPRYRKEDFPRYIQLRRRLIKECQENGVGLLLGCDAPQVFNVPGFSTHHELRYLVDAGLTPYVALRTGTVNVAAYLGRSADSGVIKVGAVSDLVLLNGNPLQDINQTTQIEGVMLGTRWLPKAYIDRELQKLEKR
jgi:imidazolonepropionase-like amidohydrolase